MALPIIGDDTPDLNGFTLMQAELNYLRQQNANFHALLALLVPGEKDRIEIAESFLTEMDPRKTLFMDREENEDGVPFIYLWTALVEPEVEPEWEKDSTDLD